MSNLRIKRGTRAKVDEAAIRGELLEGEPLLITDESRLAIATGTNTYSDMAKASEIVIERGSNANGEYVKFADGTMICTITGVTATNTATNVKSYTWTFPAVFVALPAMTGSFTNAIGSGGRALVSEAAGASSTTQGIIAVAANIGVNISTYADPAGGNLVAIGKWF